MNFSTFDSDNIRKQNYKLKYFCQICNRQCQDKDGFTCHLKSDTHRINIEIVSRNPEQFIQHYSKEFESGFIDVLKRGYNGLFVSANKVYMEYISDKNAAHLNATRWTTLTGFIKSLEQRGKIELKVREKETLIKYVDLSPEDRLKKEKKEKEILIEEIKKQKDLDKIIKKANANKEEVRGAETKNLEESNINSVVDVNQLKNITIEFKHTKEENKIIKDNPSELFLGNKRDRSISSEKPKKISEKSENKLKTDSKEEEFNLLDFPWLSKRLVVRVKDKELKEFYNKKGVVINIENEFIAEVQITNIKLKIDQALLEPVIPQSGNVKILHGTYKGSHGKIKNLDIKKSLAIVTLPEESKEITIDLKQICKYENI